jgi:hypothetical protein
MSERPITGVQVQSYYGANWFTDRGVRAKRKLIEKKGLPNLKRCLFITLTIPEDVCSPRKAYETGKAKLRRFLASIRKNFNGGHKLAWAWKLEFQANGMPHWHMLVAFPEHIPQEFLFHFEEWWGLGRVNVKRIKYAEFAYLFKYVSKEVAGDVDPETGIPLPSWVLDYKKTLKDGRVSAGIRFWQTGGGFYTREKEEVFALLCIIVALLVRGFRAKGRTGESEAPEEPQEKRSSRVPYTIRQRWAMWMRKATVFIKDAEGRYRFSRQVYFEKPYCEIKALVANLLLNGKAAGVPGYHGWRCRFSELNQYLCKTNQTDLQLPCLSSPGMVYFSAA